MQRDDAQRNGGSQKGSTTVGPCRKRPKPAGRKAARRQVIELIGRLFPPQWFTRWPVASSVIWTPLKVVLVSLIMYWIPGTGICERFKRARQIVSRLHPRWTIPVLLTIRMFAWREEIRLQSKRRLRDRQRQNTNRILNHGDHGDHGGNRDKYQWPA